MDEAFVQLLCLDCTKAWEAPPDDLPAPGERFSCPRCGETRRTAEFMRTERDLEALKSLG